MSTNSKVHESITLHIDLDVEGKVIKVRGNKADEDCKNHGVGPVDPGTIIEAGSIFITKNSPGCTWTWFGGRWTKICT